MALIEMDFMSGGGVNLDPTLVDSGYSNPSSTTITVPSNMKNAMVIITYTANNASYRPTTESAFDAKVTLPKTADKTVFFTAGHMTHKIYYYKELNSGDQFIAYAYNTTYGYDYVELIQL